MTSSLLIALALFAFTVPLPLLLQFVLAVFLPLLVGLVTTKVTSAGQKAVLLIVLSVLSSGVTEWLSSVRRGDLFDLGLWLLTALATLVTGIATHFGVWRPVGASDKAQQTLIKPKRAA